MINSTSITRLEKFGNVRKATNLSFFTGIFGKSRNFLNFEGFKVISREIYEQSLIFLIALPCLLSCEPALIVAGSNVKGGSPLWKRFTLRCTHARFSPFQRIFLKLFCSIFLSLSRTSESAQHFPFSNVGSQVTDECLRISPRRRSGEVPFFNRNVTENDKWTTYECITRTGQYIERNNARAFVGVWGWDTNVISIRNWSWFPVLVNRNRNCVVKRED